MGAFSDRMSALAIRLLTKFGQTIVFTNTTQGVFDPDTNLSAAPTTVNYNVLAAPGEYTRFERDLESVRQDDIKLTAQSTTQPEIGDKFTIDTVEYEVVSVDKVKAQGVTIIYEIQGRI